MKTIAAFKKLRWLILLVLATPAGAQVQQISIEQCYELARQNYPLIKKHDLVVNLILKIGKLYFEFSRTSDVMPFLWLNIITIESR